MGQNLRWTFTSSDGADTNGYLVAGDDFSWDSSGQLITNRAFLFGRYFFSQSVWWLSPNLLSQDTQFTVAFVDTTDPPGSGTWTGTPRNGGFYVYPADPGKQAGPAPLFIAFPGDNITMTITFSE